MTASKLKIPDTPCSRCARLLPKERYEHLGHGKRGDVCDRCRAENEAPKPCASCATLTPRDAFPFLPDGRRSKFCEPCKTRKPGRRVCCRCKKAKPPSKFQVYPSGCYARSCKQCNRGLLQPKECKGCHRMLPVENFHRYCNDSRADKCLDCRAPRVTKAVGWNTADHPCKRCGGPIRAMRSLARLNRRTTCSEACKTAIMQSTTRKCLRCNRVLPYDAFDRSSGRKGRGRHSCLECTARAKEDYLAKGSLRPSPLVMGNNTSRYAKSRGLAYTLSPEELRALHDQPCYLCGKLCASLERKNHKQGFVSGNCLPVCRFCHRLCLILGPAEVVLTANEIARRNPIDPRVTPCRCPRSKLAPTLSTSDASDSD